MSGVYLHSASMPPLLGRGQEHVLYTVYVFACIFNSSSLEMLSRFPHSDVSTRLSGPGYGWY